MFIGEILNVDYRMSLKRSLVSLLETGLILNILEVKPTLFQHLSGERAEVPDRTRIATHSYLRAVSKQ